MHWRRTAALALAAFAVAGTALAAERATVADAVEHRDRTTVRTLLKTGGNVNEPQVDGRRPE